MDFTRLKNRRGYFWSEYLGILLVGYIAGDNPYNQYLSGKVIYGRGIWGMSPAFRVGYKYDNWDWRDFEYVDHKVFHKLDGSFMKWLDKAEYEEIKAYYSLRKELEPKDEFGQFANGIGYKNLVIQ